MPAKFVSRVQMRDDESEMEFWAESLPKENTIQLGMLYHGDTMTIEIPPALVLVLAERLVGLVHSAPRAVLASDGEYPDF